MVHISLSKFSLNKSQRKLIIFNRYQEMMTSNGEKTSFLAPRFPPHSDFLLFFYSVKGAKSMLHDGEGKNYRYL
jgi:hypothetical protein